MSLSNVRIVLVESKHPGNIGAAARAMKTMGLDKLYLVRPLKFPHNEARERAVSAVDVIDHAVVSEDLQSALADCKLVIGASARVRELPMPGLDAREAGVQIVKEASMGDQVAIVFGSEESGLSNQSLDACSYQLRIPASPELTSLNLASAVQLVCYEVFMAAAHIETPTTAEPSAYPSNEELEYFYEHLDRVLRDRDFSGPVNPERILAKLRRLLTRARPKGSELQLLHGLVRLMERDARPPR